MRKPRTPKVKESEVTVQVGTAKRMLGAYAFQTREGEKTWMALKWPAYVKTCVVLALTPEKKIVLIENYRFPIKRRVLELPGGDPRSPEDPLEGTAICELAEETGYTPKTGDVEFLTQGWLQTAMSSAPFVVYLARDCVKKGAQRLDPIEEATGMTVMEMSPKELHRRIAKDPLSVDSHGIDRALLELKRRRIIP